VGYGGQAILCSRATPAGNEGDFTALYARMLQLPRWFNYDTCESVPQFRCLRLGDSSLKPQAFCNRGATTWPKQFGTTPAGTKRLGLSRHSGSKHWPTPGNSSRKTWFGRKAWRDWRPAREIAKLFPAGASTTAANPPPSSTPPSTASGPPQFQSAVSETPRPARRGGGSNRSDGFHPLASGIYFGQPLLLLGLVLVLFSKGCDAIGNRYVARLNARVDYERTKFDQKWAEKEQNARHGIADANDKIEELSDRLAEIRDMNPDDRTNDITTELENIPNQQRDLRETQSKAQRELRGIERDKRKEQRELEADEWRDKLNDAELAVPSNRMWGYLREAMFMFGTVCLAVGLLAVGFTGQGAERWICLIMLAIITFSLYIGGVAWISSIMNSVGGAPRL
jgi:hypothetical protein